MSDEEEIDLRDPEPQAILTDEADRKWLVAEKLSWQRYRVCRLGAMNYTTSQAPLIWGEAKIELIPNQRVWRIHAMNETRTVVKITSALEAAIEKLDIDPNA